MIDAGDTAFILVCSALVLLMTPGLALFYGGMVRNKNVLATIMQSVIIIGLVSVIWVLWGYSLAFGPDVAGIIGSLSWFGLKLSVISSGNIPDWDFGIKDLSANNLNILPVFRLFFKEVGVRRSPIHPCRIISTLTLRDRLLAHYSKYDI